MAHGDPLVRLAATEAVGQLGREEADLEYLLMRLNPTIESNELPRETAWRGFRRLLSRRSVGDRIKAAERLRDLPVHHDDEVWEIGVIHFPTTVQDEEDDAPWQPVCSACVPLPTLPMLTRLSLRSVTLVIPASLRANIVTGSGCTEKTERRSLNGPTSENFDNPL